MRCSLTRRPSSAVTCSGTAAMVALLHAAPAAATVMIPLGPADLARTAAYVIEGQVTGQRVVEMRDGLWTETTVRVTHAYKGALDTGTPIAVRQLGGETRTRGTRVVGAARFREGEQVLLFLRKVDRYFVVVGMCQGKYTIFRGAHGVQRVWRDLSGVTFAARPRGRRPVIVPSVHVVGVPEASLEELLQAIHAAARAGGVR